MTEQLDQYAEGAVAFVRVGTQRGIANFILEEHPKDVSTNFWGFFGLFPQIRLGSRAIYMAFSVDSERELPSYSKVLSLRVPERVRQIPIRQDTPLLMRWQSLMAVAQMPYVLLAVGERIREHEEVMTLFCVPGITPEKALREIQNRTREAIAQNN